jgi:hypothetical protein
VIQQEPIFDVGEPRRFADARIPVKKVSPNYSLMRSSMVILCFLISRGALGEGGPALDRTIPIIVLEVLIADTSIGGLGTRP